MLDVNINFKNICISNIQRRDVQFVYDLINLETNLLNHSNKECVKVKEVYERFLECYISENELFLKIEMNEEIIGVLRGRIDFKSNIEMWITYFFIRNNLMNNGFGSKILNKILEYFKNEYMVEKFYSTVSNENLKMIKFWKNSGYEIMRISKNYYNVDGQYKDMIILRKGR